MGAEMTSTDAALAADLVGAERELVATRFKLKMSQLENTASLRVLRRRIARLRTEIARRERTQGLTKGSLVARNRGGASTAGGESASAPARTGFLAGLVDKLAGKE